LLAASLAAGLLVDVLLYDNVTSPLSFAAQQHQLVFGVLALSRVETRVYMTTRKPQDTVQNTPPKNEPKNRVLTLLVGAEKLFKRNLF